MQKSQKWAEYPLTEKQAIAIYDSGVWEKWTPEQIVRCQLFQSKLCVKFSFFCECIEHVFGREIIELGLSQRTKLIERYLSRKTEPTLSEIMELIPDGIIIAPIKKNTPPQPIS